MMVLKVPRFDVARRRNVGKFKFVMVNLKCYSAT
jgi:hypothetical protein